MISFALQVDSYGCGDSFAAGITAGFAAGWGATQAFQLGAVTRQRVGSFAPDGSASLLQVLPLARVLDCATHASRSELLSER